MSSTAEDPTSMRQQEQQQQEQALESHLRALHSGLLAESLPAVPRDHASRFRKNDDLGQDVGSGASKKVLREDDPISGQGKLTIQGPLAAPINHNTKHDADAEQPASPSSPNARGNHVPSSVIGSAVQGIESADAKDDWHVADEKAKQFWEGEDALQHRMFLTDEQRDKEDEDIDALLDDFRDKQTPKRKK